MNMPDHPELIDKIETLVKNAAETSRAKKSSSKPPKSDPKWFDEGCKELKKQIQTYGKDLRRSPNNPAASENIFVLKKKLRNRVKRNKYLYKKSIIDKMCTDLSKGQQKTYWKLLKNWTKRQILRHIYIINILYITLRKCSITKMYQTSLLHQIVKYN